MTTPPVAVFDFDDTLLPSDAFTGFFKWLLRREPWRLIAVLTVLPVCCALYFAEKKQRANLAIGLGVWAGTLGVNQDRLLALIALYVEQTHGAREITVRMAGRERINMHQGLGHRVIIATGALEPLARALCTSQGIKDVDIAGSSLRPGLGGLVADRRSYGEYKTSLLTERGFPPLWDYAYTDNLTDIPLLKGAKFRFLVNPKPKTKARLSQEFGESLNVLLW